MEFRDRLELRRVLEELVRQTSLTPDVIAEAFLNARVEVSPGLVGWGQYLDRPGSRQHGLYGTAAGVGALGVTGKHAALREGGVAYLLGRYDGRSRNATDRYEFELVPKIAGFLRAFAPHDLTDPRVMAACSDLITVLSVSQVRDAGWGYYTGSPTPAVLPTCLALLAVEHLGQLNRLRDYEVAVDWLSNQVARHFKTTHPGEIALSLLTLRRCRPHSSYTVELARTGDAHRWLVAQLSISPIAWEEYFVSYEAVTRVNNNDIVHDEYFVVPSPIFILEYLSRYFTPYLLRPHVLGVCVGMVDNILRNRMYVSSFNQRAASRPNLWALELCLVLNQSIQERLDESPVLFLGRGYASAMLSILSKRVVVWGVAVAIAVAPVAVEDPKVLVTGFLTSFLTSVFANLWTQQR